MGKAKEIHFFFLFSLLCFVLFCAVGHGFNLIFPHSKFTGVYPCWQLRPCPTAKEANVANLVKVTLITQATANSRKAGKIKNKKKWKKRQCNKIELKCKRLAGYKGVYGGRGLADATG